MMLNILRRYARSEEGVMTVFGIILIALMIAVGGIGLDYANGIRNRTHLQIAADAAAHAALVAREYRTE